MFDANKGYQGYSMSKRASAAYDNGEMPKSKWTKKAMLEAIECACDDMDLLYVEPKMTKSELFDRFMACTSWHHTSKLFNETDFYAVDSDAVADEFEPMTAEQMAARDSAETARIAAIEAERMAAMNAEQERRDAVAKFESEHGYRFGSYQHYIDANGIEVSTRLNKKGRVIADFDTEFGERHLLQSQLSDSYVIGWHPEF